jgi:hypothetical protein
MAGRGHHFIAQLLLRGFSTCRTASGEQQVWVCRRGGPPFLSGTRNVAKQRDFYGEPDSELDALITAHEGQIAGTVQKYRDLNDSCHIGRNDHAVELALMASVRTRWIRIAFQRLVSEALDIFDFSVRRYGDAGFLLRYVEDNRDWWIDTVRQDIAVRLGRADPEFVTAVADALVAMLRGGSLPLGETDVIRPILAHLRARIPEICRRGHLQGIRGLFDKPGWREKLSTLEWRLQLTSGGIYVLGDFGPLFVSSSGDVGPIGVASRDLSGVVMPISSRALLIGGEVLSGLTAPKLLNQLTSEWTLDMIVCADVALITDSLRAAMASRMERFITATVQESLSDLSFQ